MIKSYFYKLLHKYIALYVRPGNSLVEIHPQSDLLLRLMTETKTAVVTSVKNSRFSCTETLEALKHVRAWQPDFILLNGNIHYERDIQRFLEDLYTVCHPTTRIIIVYYSSLWRPLTRLATFFKLRLKSPEQNWIASEDIDNLLLLAGFDSVRRDRRVLLPIYVPLLSNLVNRYLASLPFFRTLTMVNVIIARPMSSRYRHDTPSVSIVVPARNEAGNIEQLVTRLPKMGTNDELIFIEGHSTDNTWEVIQEASKKYAKTVNIKIAQQDGKGKGNAVRNGFAMATQEILMILDADLTVPPEDLPKFYQAIVSGKGEFINGSRLVYPMEKKAMRFFNILGNAFFASAFSFVLGQRFKDTLCGTKVLSRENYLKIAKHRSYFGEFDPFGDFDLLFGASRLGLKIVEIPILYRERTYGDTNIQRWKHGVILLRMVLFAAKKIKFI